MFDRICKGSRAQEKAGAICTGFFLRQRRRLAVCLHRQLVNLRTLLGRLDPNLSDLEEPVEAARGLAAKTIEDVVLGILQEGCVCMQEGHAASVHVLVTHVQVDHSGPQWTPIARTLESRCWQGLTATCTSLCCNVNWTVVGAVKCTVYTVVLLRNRPLLEVHRI